MFAVRRLVEGGMVAQLGNLPVAAIQSLHAHVHEEDEARISSDNKRLLRLAGDFHMLLGQLAGNGVLQRMLRDLVTRSVLATALYQPSGGSGCRTDDHRNIVKLLEAGKHEEAGRFMVRHLDMIENSLAFDQSADPRPDLTAVLENIKRRR